MNFLKRVQLVFNKSKHDEYIREFMSGGDGSGSDFTITDQTALKYATLYACCRVLAEAFASTPIGEYKKDFNTGDRKPTDDTGLFDILRNVPNEEMSAYNFHEVCMYQLNLNGNFVCKRIVNRFDEVIGLYPYDFHKIDIERNESTNKIEYTIRKNNGVGTITKSRKDLFHVVGNSLNGVVGMSPISYAASAIKLGMTYEIYGQQLFKNGALPSGNFEHPTFLKEEAYLRLKKDLKDNWQGLINAGKPMLLEDGLTFNPITFSPVDAQLLDSKKFQKEDVCGVYRVPLHLIQNLDKATYSNIEHQSLEFVMYTMLPWFKRYETSVNTQLLTKAQREDGYYFEFNMAGLLRGDFKSMSEAFSKGRQWGWLSVNDIRRMLNLNSIPNGDIYLQPMNMIEAGTEMKKFKNKIKNDILQVIEESIKKGK